MNGAASWATVLAVAAGAAIGALLRWGAGLWINSAWHGFALGTLLVNCAGGFMIGLAVVAFEQWSADTVRAFVITGFLGGLTTFSAFSAESLHLLQRGQWFMAVLHASAHVFGALACVAAGFALARLCLRA